MIRLLTAALALIAVPAIVQRSAPLPPVMPWSGASEKLVVAADDPWITPAEQNDFIETPDYTAARA